jgi:ATP-dependent DNA helicase Rep
MSLFAAAFEGEFQRELGGRQLDDLLTFCQYINKLQGRATKDPAGEVLNDMLTAIQYEVFLYDSEEPHSAEVKWKNVMDFVGWLTRKA